MNYNDPELRALLAGEYVLGTLPPRARRRFKRLMVADAALREEVARWQLYLDSLGEAVPPVRPPERVWRRIEARLDALGTARAPRRLRPAGPAAQRPGPPPPRLGRRLWDSLPLWRGVGLAASALAAAILLYVAIRPPEEPPPPPTTVAVVANGGPGWLIEANAAENWVGALALQPHVLDPGRAFELWAVPAEGAPRSLGLLPASGRGGHALTTEQSAALADTAAFAVSLEPEGGSPTGAPTGPVLFQGTVIHAE
jgi:anti-sigma-K factor RskA